MKKAVFKILLISIPFTSLAQSPWSPVTNGISYTAGNVGIGTSNPTQKLYVAGTAYADLLQTATINKAPTDNFTYDGKSFGNYALSWQMDSWATSPTAWFSGFAGIKFFSQRMPRMSIDYYGNVGIGTTSPTTLLEIRKSIDYGNTGNQYVAPYYIGSSNDYGGGGAEQYLLLTPYISQAGGNPSAGLSGKLSFYRGSVGTYNFGAEYNIFIQTAYSTTNVDVIPLNALAPLVNIYKVDYAGVSYVAIKVRDIVVSGGHINFMGHYWNNVNSQNPALVLSSGVSNISVLKSYESGLGNLIYGLSNGTVGIGTTDTKGYKLAVNGSAIFTKAVVKSYANWPDYVFDKDYTLMPLDSVEAFVQANGHLPEIPSADEVSKTGIDLGDNQTKLLQKIEELTLYLINQSKVNAEQKALLEQQDAKIASLLTVVGNLKTQMDRLKGNK